jgi:hypothetical protein
MTANSLLAFLGALTDTDVLALFPLALAAFVTALLLGVQWLVQGWAGRDRSS